MTRNAVQMILLFTSLSITGCRTTPSAESNRRTEQYASVSTPRAPEHGQGAKTPTEDIQKPISPPAEQTTSISDPQTPPTDGQTSKTPKQGNDKPDGPKEQPSSPPRPVSAGITEVIEERDDEGRLLKRQEVIRNEVGEAVPNGMTIFWWESGEKKSEFRYVDGKPDGPRISWYPSGQVWIEGLFRDGKEDGLWTHYWPNGKKQGEMGFDNGAWHGVHRHWYESGQKRDEGEWVMGKQKGVHTVWDENGKVVRQTDYGDPVKP